MRWKRWHRADKFILVVLVHFRERVECSGEGCNRLILRHDLVLKLSHLLLHRLDNRRNGALINRLIRTHGRRGANEDDHDVQHSVFDTEVRLPTA